MLTAHRTQKRAPLRPSIVSTGACLPEPQMPAATLTYPWIHATLPDGSSFYLPVYLLLQIASRGMAARTSSPQAHFQCQLLPAAIERPGLILAIARRIGWSRARQLAVAADWRSSSAVCERAWCHAKLTLTLACTHVAPGLRKPQCAVLHKGSRSPQ